MTRVALIAEIAASAFAQWPPRDNGDAVITLLAVNFDMVIAKVTETGIRKLAVSALGFLEAQDVGTVFLQITSYERHAQAHGIDVPSC